MSASLIANVQVQRDVEAARKDLSILAGPFSTAEEKAMSELLIGKTIIGISVAADKKAIKFDLSDGDSVIAKTDGDCCSETWIEYLENPELAIGAPVLSVENVPMRNERPSRESLFSEAGARYGRNGFIQYYGCKIVTVKGEMLLEYRNGSNGFYGGSLCWPDDNFYGGVRGQNISNEKWKPIEAG